MTVRLWLPVFQRSRLWLPILQWRVLGVLVWPVGGYMGLWRCNQVNLGSVCGHFWMNVVHQWCFRTVGGHFGQLRLVLVDKANCWGSRLVKVCFMVLWMY